MKRIAFFVALMLFGTSVSAQLPVEALSLEQALDYAFAHNPAWEAEQAKVRQSGAMLDGAGGWEAPKMKIQQFIEPIETRLGPQKQVISLSQSIPFWGQTDMKVRGAQKLVQAAQFNLALKKRELRRDVTATYYDLWQYSKIPALLNESQKVIERLAQTGSIEIQRNQRMLDSIFDIQAKIGENAFALAQMRDHLSDAKTRLNRLLGRSGRPQVDSVQAPRLERFHGPLAPLIKRALKEHPQLLALRAVEDATQQQLALADSQARAPNVEVGINYFKIDAGKSNAAHAGKDAYNLSLGFSIPWGNTKTQARFAFSEQLKQEKTQNRIDYEQQIQEKVTEHYNHVINAGRLVDLLEQQVLPPARKADFINQRLYGGGDTSMSLSLRSKAQLIGLEIKAVQAKAEYLKALVQLEEWVGPLDEAQK